MKISVYILIVGCILAFLSITSFPYLDKTKEYLDMTKELLDIKVYGTYYSGDPKEIEDNEKYWRKEGVLKEGETLADSWQTAHFLEFLGKERFKTRLRPLIYCYGKIMDEDRESAVVFNPDLRARMYDREGNLLAEDVLRDRLPGRHPFAKFTVAYLPYLKDGDVAIRFVQLEGDKEIVLRELKGLRSYENFLKHRRNQNPLPGGYSVRQYGYWLQKYNNTYCYVYYG